MEAGQSRIIRSSAHPPQAQISLKEHCLPEAPPSHISTAGFWWLDCCLYLSLDLVSDPSSMSSRCFLPGCWSLLGEFESGVRHLSLSFAFQQGVISHFWASITNRSPPYSLPPRGPGSQERLDPRRASPGAGCCPVVRQGTPHSPPPTFSLKPKPSLLRDHLSPSCIRIPNFSHRPGSPGSTPASP